MSEKPVIAGREPIPVEVIAKCIGGAPVGARPVSPFAMAHTKAQTLPRRAGKRPRQVKCSSVPANRPAKRRSATGRIIRSRADCGRYC